ncbi:MAG: TIGR03621 family F420-dependent LLM class oxidoreductase [Actinobacteria bacterium]|nr:TIGR03621 family F420-dependent LLM class oxidoreductase [Actinomycetota bacterium]
MPSEPPSPHTARPFRVGVQASSAASGKEWRDVAKEAEDLGYHVLSVADHLDDQFATAPAIMAAADVTANIRLGAVVFCNDYHHPVVLAKEAATLDLLTDGRLEFGLGAGWQKSDYTTSGIPLDEPKRRIDRLEEALTVITGLWAPEPLTFAGEHYRVRGLDGRPKPVQSPRPPLFVGGGGKHMLSVAARCADIVGLNIDMRHGRIGETSGPTATAEATDHKVAWVREAAGGRFGDIELQARIHLAAVTDDRLGLAEAVAPALGLTTEQALETPHGLGGTVEQIVEQCLQRRERYGISYLTISVDAMREFAPVVAALRAL